jgi:hypothetical protein
MLANPWIRAEVHGGDVRLFKRGNGALQEPLIVISAADAEALAQSLHKAALSAVPHPNDLLTRRVADQCDGDPRAERPTVGERPFSRRSAAVWAPRTAAAERDRAKDDRCAGGAVGVEGLGDGAVRGTLSTRVRDDDPTRDPLYLIQRRVVRLDYDGARAIDAWDDEGDPLHPETGEAMSIDDLIAHGWAEITWRTVLVAFTREEADRYCKAKSYDGVFRSYSVPAHGALIGVLAALTVRE